jgi:CRISPR-associated protein Csc1
MLQIYRCELRLLEQTFFSTREISNLYQTEAFIGHLALCYALGLAPSRYYNDGKSIHYREDLAALNERGIYITPATIQGAARFTLGQFNAQPDSYWSAMGNNALVVVPQGMWAEKDGNTWYITDGVTRRKYGVENRPQFGRIRALAVGNQAEFFVISETELTLPNYIRLGKWMSKARLTIKPTRIAGEQVNGTIPFLLAPADLASTSQLLAYDLLNVAPTPLVRNSRIAGACYVLDQQILLPKGMRFNLEGLR